MLRYRGRISGPLLDRIDLQLFVPRVERETLTAASAPAAESSEQVRSRVVAARERQQARQGKPNAALGPKELEQHCRPEPTAQALLETAMTRLSLSARAYHRVLKVARSIADMEGAGVIGKPHVAEAVRYRELDRGQA